MSKEVLTVEEVAERYRVSIFTVYTWVKQGRIPFFRMNRRIYFCCREIEAFEKNQKA